MRPGGPSCKAGGWVQSTRTLSWGEGLPRGSPTLRAPLTLPGAPAPLSWAAVSQPLWPAAMLGWGDRVWALLAAGTFLRSSWDGHPQPISSVAPGCSPQSFLGGPVISTSIAEGGRL